MSGFVCRTDIKLDVGFVFFWPIAVIRRLQIAKVQLAAELANYCIEVSATTLLALFVRELGQR